jgi:hypothetical protein
MSPINGSFSTYMPTQSGRRFVLVAAAILLAAVSAHADFSLMTSPGSGSDSVNWSTLGPAGTSIGTAGNVPFNINSAGGVTLTVSDSISNPLKIEQQSIGNLGNFAPNAYMLWTNMRNSTPNTIMVNFGGPVSSAGAQIQAGVMGIYTAQITAYNANGQTIASFTEIGSTSMNNGANTAIYLGVSSTMPDIYSVGFNIVNQVGNLGGNTMAPPGLVSDMIIGEVDFQPAAIATPAPPSGLMGLIGAATGILIWRLRGRRRAAIASS